MEAKDSILAAPKLNVRLIVFAALATLVLIAGVTRSLHISAADKITEDGLSVEAGPAVEDALVANARAGRSH
jgi:hypothetical protein